MPKVAQYRCVVRETPAESRRGRPASRPWSASAARCIGFFKNHWCSFADSPDAINAATFRFWSNVRLFTARSGAGVGSSPMPLAVPMAPPLAHQPGGLPPVRFGGRNAFGPALRPGHAASRCWPRLCPRRNTGAAAHTAAYPFPTRQEVSDAGTPAVSAGVAAPPKETSNSDAAVAGIHNSKWPATLSRSGNFVHCVSRDGYPHKRQRDDKPPCRMQSLGANVRSPRR